VAMFDAKALYPTDHLNLSRPDGASAAPLPLGLAGLGLALAIATDRWLSHRQEARRSGRRRKPTAAIRSHMPPRSANSVLRGDRPSVR
jgi:hypothetical protein